MEWQGEVSRVVIQTMTTMRLTIVMNVMPVATETDGALRQIDLLQWPADKSAATRAQSRPAAATPIVGREAGRLRVHVAAISIVPALQPNLLQWPADKSAATRAQSRPAAATPIVGREAGRLRVHV